MKNMNTNKNAKRLGMTPDEYAMFRYLARTRLDKRMSKRNR